MNYTPPPWTVAHFVDVTDPDNHSTEQGLYEVEEANERINGWRKDGELDKAQEEAEANRRLIEAAPDMYAALFDPTLTVRALALAEHGRCKSCTNPADPKLEGWCDNCAEAAWESHYSDLDRVSADERHEQAWKQKEELR